MMHRLIGFLFCALVTPLSIAAEAVVFKQPFAPKINWLSYGFSFLVLLIIAVAVAKKHKPALGASSNIHLLEKKNLGNKTVIYVLHYQNQHFILADNQQALALHPINSGEHHE